METIINRIKSSFKVSKEDKMLHYLKVRKNKWVNGWNMVQYVKTLHHTQLIKNLRDKGYTIKNKTEHCNKRGIRKTYYKLVDKS